MAAGPFIVQEHVIPASFIRGYERGVQDEASDEGLRLSVKQYTPRNNASPKLGDPTIIFTHGSGIAKEAYEPMLEALLNTEGNSSIQIRSIWSIDSVQSGASYILNEGVIGDEVHIFDHSRDILHTINHFQSAMKPPLIGIAHSLGAGQILTASSYHPRLFDAVVAIEPGVESGYDAPVSFPKAITVQLMLNARRRDDWPSREDACKQLRKSPLYAGWDARAFDLEMQYGLRDVNDADKKGNTRVTLTTPNVMQLATDPRPDPPLQGRTPAADYASRYRNGLVIPGFYRTEPRAVYEQLASLSNHILYISGKQSPTNPHLRDKIVRHTQSAVMGDEKLLASRVVLDIIPNAGHCVPLERPEATAAVIRRELARWRQRWLQEYDARKSQAPFSKKVDPELLARVAKL